MLSTFAHNLLSGCHGHGRPVHSFPVRQFQFQAIQLLKCQRHAPSAVKVPDELFSVMELDMVFELRMEVALSSRYRQNGHMWFRSAHEEIKSSPRACTLLSKGMFPEAGAAFGIRVLTFA